MSGAQRTARYRQNKLDDQLFEHLQHLGRVNLLEMLGRDLRLLDDYQAGLGDPDLLPDLIEGGRLTAGKVVGELVKRYGLVLPRRKPGV